uniref:Uncharacterized protein n=1 Tax=Esox lucius TaxID=8010 RepID=A0A3P8ZTG2_ESOLU
HSCSNDNRQAVSQQLIKKGALQHTQLRIGALDVIHNDLSMSGDHGVCLDGSRIVQVSEVTEIPLGPRVDDQTPVNSNIIIHLPEDALDGCALKVCPLNHIDVCELYQ